MRNTNASDSQIGRVMGKFTQDIVDLSDADTAPAGIEIGKTAGLEATPAGEDVETLGVAIEDADQT